MRHLYLDTDCLCLNITTNIFKLKATVIFILMGFQMTFYLTSNSLYLHCAQFSFTYTCTSMCFLRFSVVIHHFVTICRTIFPNMFLRIQIQILEERTAGAQNNLVSLKLFLVLNRIPHCKLYDEVFLL